MPDAKYGEELMAWVRMREGVEPLTAEAVREFCTGKLAHYKIPRYVHVVDEFPMTVTGKIRKVEMRAKSVELLGLDDTTDTPRQAASARSSRRSSSRGRTTPAGPSC